MRSLVGVVAASVFLVTVAAPSYGAQSQRHCAALLVQIGPADGGVVPVRLEDLGCYATLADAVVAGSDGNIRLPESFTPARLTDAALQEATLDPAGLVMIGTEWDANGFGGTSQSYFRSSTCAAGVSYEESWVGAAFNDLFSSGKGFGGCDNNRKFEDLNFGGSSILCTPNCSNYGSLSNKVSSLRWSH